MLATNNIFKTTDRARDLLATRAASGQRLIKGFEISDALGLNSRVSAKVWAQLVETEWLRPWCRDDWESILKPVFLINFVLAEERWRKEMGLRRIWKWTEPTLRYVGSLITFVTHIHA
jgi:hypothetical protein